MDTTPSLSSRFNAFELWLCVVLNQLRARPIVFFFTAVSKLGDGWFWLGLTAYFIGAGHGVVAAHMIALGAVSYVLYKYLKRTTARPRPADANPDRIAQLTAALDLHSFPSGHTLHAVAFSIVIVAYLPEFFWLVVPFTVLVALSRLVLGLHYPSDVVAGILIGAGLAFPSLLFLR
ncbi:MAG: phosphatase PAP2 family protein [Acidobacteriota bacterium]